MSRKKIQTWIFCFVLLISTISVCSISASANPIAVSLLDQGAAFHNGEFIQMPYANVEINITRTGKNVIVDLVGIYNFETNQTQNTTLAYVYPALYSDTLQDEVLHILVDSVETNYTIRTLEELQDAFNLTDEIRQYTSIYADLAFFNINLLANQSITLEVHSRTNLTLSNVQYWYYNYIFGSARTFDGDTLERIHIHLLEETSFFETSFTPDYHLDLIRNGIVSDATWEFNVSDLEENRVTLTGLVNLPAPSLVEILALSVVVIAILCIVVVKIKR